jgi:hemerythrin superfamily protein
MARGLDALELLREDHQRVEQLFRRFERARGDEDQGGIIQEACEALAEHADLEEQFFYPMVLAMTGDEQLMNEAQIEHMSARQLIEELRGGKVQAPRQLALFHVLMEYMRLHIQEEESRIFPLVKKTGIDLEAFGEELAERKGQPAPAVQKGRGKAAGSDARAVAERRRAPQEQRRGASSGGDGEEEHHDPSAKENEAYKAAHQDGLSRTTMRAKWINAADEHEDRPGQSLATRSHEVIRRWAEERQAAPATTPGGDPERPRVLRFNFPGYDRKLQEISWDAWFGTFDERDLVFIYQEHMKAGNPSNFFKFDSPEREHE